ncbi:MAG TPA: Hsp20/alpha crystallin family protein [Spirochaetota bacterium]|nr:Hsp20/alpha crystallin family protein [Spirochaetota bacterium]
MLMPYTLLNDVFNFTNAFDVLFKGTSGKVSEGGPYPHVNVYEKGDIVKVRALVPGIGAESLNVEIKDNRLVIEGERKKDPETAKYLRRERGYGSFRKIVALPYPVNGETINAVLRDGILTVTLEKREDVKPRKIEIR